MRSNNLLKDYTIQDHTGKIITSDLEDCQSEFKLFRLKNPPYSHIAINTQNQNERWYASCSVFNMMYVLENPVSHRVKENNFCFHDSEMHSFLVSLAVAAGNIYRLLLGDTQPPLLLGRDEKGCCWRLSKEVANFKIWGQCITNSKVHAKILGLNLISSSHFVQDQEKQIPINKLTKVLIASLFLNDCDMNPGNFGLVRKDNEIVTVKIDPECCFNLDLLETPEKVKYKIKYFLENENHSSELWNILKDNFKNPQDLLNIIHSNHSQSEKLDLLKTISEMSFVKFMNILQRDIIALNDETKKLKKDLINAVQTRQENFKLAYASIKASKLPKLVLDMTTSMNESDFSDTASDEENAKFPNFQTCPNTIHTNAQQSRARRLVAEKMINPFDDAANPKKKLKIEQPQYQQTLLSHPFRFKFNERYSNKEQQNEHPTFSDKKKEFDL